MMSGVSNRLALQDAVRWLALCAVILSAPSVHIYAQPAQSPPPDARYRAGALLYSDDFRRGLGQWRIEAEKPGKIVAHDGLLDIDVPAGATVWFRQELNGPVKITYEATVVSSGGPNDRVSDLNSFWMATDPSSPALFAHARSGAFASYNALSMYYVGLGGNGNSTTRLRRYDGVSQPLLPENDISIARRPEMGIVANHAQIVTLIADGPLIQYWRDGTKIFEMIDQHPYTHGWFGIRTTQNHMQVRHLRIVRLISAK